MDGHLSIDNLPKAANVLCDKTCLQTPFSDGYALLEEINEDIEEKNKKYA